MKIALVCTSVNELGGKNNHLKNIYLYLIKAGFDVDLVLCSAVEDELRDFLVRGGVFPHNLVFMRQWKKRLIVPFIFELMRIFKERRVGIVHTFQEQSDVFGGLAAHFVGIKQLYSYHESKIIPDNISFFKAFFYKIANLFMKKWFKKTIVVSKGLYDEILALKYRAEESVEIIRLGIEIPKKYLKNDYDFSRMKSGAPVIGTIARFSYEKALDRIIKAAPSVLRYCPQARFVIIGKGPEESSLEKLAEELDVKKQIFFKPWAEDVFKELAQIDIFVMSSMREGCPNILLEAMALSRPIVASNISGINEIIKDGYNGLLVDASDPDKFAEKVVSLCCSVENAILFGKNAYLTVKSEFTIEKEVESFKSLYGILNS